MYSIYADDELIYTSAADDSRRIVINPTIGNEMGKASSLQFGLPVFNVCYDWITEFKTKVKVIQDGRDIFRGRVLTINVDFDNFKSISCESDLAYLVDSAIRNDSYIGTTRDFFSKIISKHNEIIQETYKQFTVGEVTIDDRELIIQGQSDKETNDDGTNNLQQIRINASTTEWKSAYDYINSYLIAYCGGFMRTRRVGNTTYIDLLKDNYGTVASQQIEFGKNVLDISREMKSTELFTVLIPLGDDNLTIESVNDGSCELVNEELVSKYGRIIKTKVFSNVNTPSKLLQNAQLYIADNSKTKETIIVKAVDLHFVDPNIEGFEVGQVVRIISEPNGINRNVVCTADTLYLDAPENNDYTFGEPEQSLTKIFLEDKKKSGGGGSGSKKEEEAEKKAIGDYFNAVFNFNPETAHIDLTAVFKKLDEDHKNVDNMKYVFENSLGLSIDAPSGKIDLTNVRTMLEEIEGKTLASQASLHSFQGDLEKMMTRIEMLASSTSYYNNEIRTHVAEISNEVSWDKAQINLLVGEAWETQKGIRLISERVNGTEETVTLIDTDVTRIKSRLTTVENLMAKAITTDFLTANGLSNLRLLSVTGTSTFRNLAGFYNGLSVYSGSSSFNGNVSIMQPFILKVGGKEVATQEYVQNQGFATEDWVKSRGYLRTANWITDVTNRPTMIEKSIMINGEKVWYWSPRP